MWVLASAVLMASLLGSMHCVGMCGPLAIWASGATEPQTRARAILNSSLYHVGRLLTYLLMGIVAGSIGQLIDLGGSAIGVQVAAARIVGATMIILGLVRLWTLAPWQSGTVKELIPSRIGGLLVRLRPYVFRLPPGGRALATGLLTTFLPCGWLYLFALVAAGTGSVWLGPIVMGAFWIGTVPALAGLVAGARMLSRKFTVAVPAVAAVLLVVTGCYTASGRGFASIGSLEALHIAAECEVSELKNAPLPCCQCSKK